MFARSSREDEIAQGLREEGGALIGGLNAEDYVAGIEDFEAGREPPKGLTSTSYDLGRARARQKAEFMAEFEAEQERRHQSVREMLKDRPAVLAEYDAKIAAIRAATPTADTPSQSR